MIKSPSRVLADTVGQHLPTGIIRGMEQTMPKLKAATEKMGLATIPSLSNVNIPQSARNGVYGNQTSYTTNFSPNLTVNANNPFQAVQEYDRLVRRHAFQRGI